MDTGNFLATVIIFTCGWVSASSAGRRVSLPRRTARWHESAGAREPRAVVTAGGCSACTPVASSENSLADAIWCLGDSFHD
jgi:hypothetical protein